MAVTSRFSKNGQKFRWVGRRRKQAARSTRDMLVDHLKRVPCADCGKTYPSEAMDFDHRPGTAKVDMVSNIQSLRALAAEVKKCDVVCAICHRIRTRARQLGQL